MALLKVKDHNGFYKDTSTGAVVNTNTSDYERYVHTRSKLLEDQERLESLEGDLNDVKGDLKDIKSLLLKVLESNG